MGADNYSDGETLGGFTTYFPKYIGPDFGTLFEINRFNIWGIMNVYSNIFLGREKLRKFLGLVNVLDHEHMQSESKKILNRLGIEIPSLKNKIRNLSGGQRQAVAIARSIYWNAKLLIMDEPTAALGVAEQKKVLNLVKTLSSQGVSIIIISHQIHDVFSVATRLIIMRRAKKVAERITKKTSADEVVGLIVGSLPGDYIEVSKEKR